MGMFLRRGPAPHRMRMSDLEIGQTIQLNLRGTPWEWLVVHQGLPSAIYDASCDGTWLLSKDIYEKRQWNSTNVDNYENSTIQSYLNGDFLNLFDGNVKGAIKQVKIPYRKGGSDGTDQSGANGLSCKVFLLGGYEVGFTTSETPYLPLDGAKLSYFEAGDGTSARNKRIAKLNGSDTLWWLRSQYLNPKFTPKRALLVWSDGRWTNNDCVLAFGIRPALILPSDFIVSKEMLAA